MVDKEVPGPVGVVCGRGHEPPELAGTQQELAEKLAEVERRLRELEEGRP